MCCLLFNCKTEVKKEHLPFTSVEINELIKDSLLNVRALEYDDEYIFYGSSDHLGKIALSKELKIDINEFKVTNNKNHFRYVIKNDNDKSFNFRAIKNINGNLFGISTANPGRLYLIERKASSPKLVYEEVHESVFYDSMDFWNDQEGIAIGDSIDGCLSVIITRDGGATWTKLTCDQLPKGVEGEGAFAASDTNIAIVGDKTWVATIAGRIYFSADKGHTWSVTQTPIISKEETQGIYSLDFYDSQNGFGIGGDYTKAADSSANKIRTQDGGKTWQLVAENKSPGYRSCVQYVPNSNAKQLVAVGFKGIDYSSDSGENWTHLSDEGFYTIRFLNDTTAYAAGKGRIAKLTFK